MVQCDSCDKWYHFECVNLTEEMAQDLMQYFCTECRGRGSLVRKVTAVERIEESTEEGECRRGERSEDGNVREGRVIWRVLGGSNVPFRRELKI